jgi:allantoinase
VSELDLVIVGGRSAIGERLDVGVRDGRVAVVAGDLTGEAPSVLDATGCHVLPGAVDVHVHCNAPGHDDWEGVISGTAALACGGTTTACDMPHHASPPTLDVASLRAKQAAWEGRSAVDYAFWGGIVPGNRHDLPELAAHGVVGLKAYMVRPRSEEFAAVGEDDLLDAMRFAAAAGLPVGVHAEDGATVARRTAALADAPGAYADYLASRPAEAEVAAVARALAMAEDAGCALHLVHLSLGASVALVAEARARGVDVTCETCPHYLTFTAADAERLGTVAKCAPPIRPAPARDELWRAVREGGIDFVSTDHSPCPAGERAGSFLDARAGINAAQMLLVTLLGGELPLDVVVERSAAAAARRFGFAGKGTIEPGAPADLVLVDLCRGHPLSAADLHTRHRESPFVGLALAGRVTATLVGGVVVACDGAPTGTRPGRLLRGAAVIS